MLDMSLGIKLDLLFKVYCLAENNGCGEGHSKVLRPERYNWERRERERKAKATESKYEHYNLENMKRHELAPRL